MLASHMSLICSITFKALIRCVSMSMWTPQSACGLTNGHVEIHENPLEDPGVIDTKSD